MFKDDFIKNQNARWLKELEEEEKQKEQQMKRARTEVLLGHISSVSKEAIERLDEAESIGLLAAQFELPTKYMLRKPQETITVDLQLTSEEHEFVSTLVRDILCESGIVWQANELSRA